MSWRNHRFFFKNPISYSCFAIHGWKQKHQLKNKKTAYFEFSGGTQTNSRGQDGSELFITSFSTTQQMTAHTVRKFFLKNSKVSPTTRGRKWKRWWRIGRDIWTMPRIGLFPEPHVLSRKEIVSVMIWVCRQPLPFQKMFFFQTWKPFQTSKISIGLWKLPNFLLSTEESLLVQIMHSLRSSFLTSTKKILLQKLLSGLMLR